YAIPGATHQRQADALYGSGCDGRRDPALDLLRQELAPGRGIAVLLPPEPSALAQLVQVAGAGLQEQLGHQARAGAVRAPGVLVFEAEDPGVVSAREGHLETAVECHHRPPGGRGAVDLPRRARRVPATGRDDPGLPEAEGVIHEAVLALDVVGLEVRQSPVAA